MAAAGAAVIAKITSVEAAIEAVADTVTGASAITALDTTSIVGRALWAAAYQ